ncbi:MAG: TMEM14 family protein [Chlamydiales bacterium]|nr:TMEM14 family protein [Chlamydiales bacterium]
MFILIVYAILIIAGGIVGYASAGSKLSLIMGCGFGLMLLGSAFALYKKKKAATWIAIALILLLDAFFSYRYAQTHKFLPSGLLSLISLGVLLFFVLQTKKSESKR